MRRDPQMSTPADPDLDALREVAGLLAIWADLAALAGVEPDKLTRWWRAVNGIPEPHPPPEHDERSGRATGDGLPGRLLAADPAASGSPAAAGAGSGRRTDGPAPWSRQSSRGAAMRGCIC